MRVLVVCPHYTEQICTATSRAIYLHAAKESKIIDVVDSQSSLLARGFNILWRHGLNLHNQGIIDAVAMLHADIDPGQWWVDRLAHAMEQHGADVVGAISPIKNFEGNTSTAIGTPGTEWGCLRHVTGNELDNLPETFTAADCGHPEDDLLINTGCMLVRLGDWCKPPLFSGFEVRDRLVLTDDGSDYVVQTVPEDWGFSRHAKKMGKKIIAAKIPGLKHWGPAPWMFC